jgi:capsular polysaccharide biosynthesis protein
MLLTLKENNPLFKYTYLKDFRDSEIHLNSDLSFLSNKKKFRFYPSRNYYHFMYDFLGNLLDTIDNEEAEDIEIIIDFAEDHLNSDKIILFLEDFLQKNNVKNYYFVKHGQTVSINNFYHIGTTAPSLALHNNIYEKLLKAYPSNLKDPKKMVYVSRRSPIIDQRIDDVEQIENFFKDLGFEIFLENDIGDTNIIDTIKYFRDVNVLAGISGAGLANSIFMQPGKTVLEIAVPQFTPVPKYENMFPEMYTKARHSFNPFISFAKDHTHIQISVNTSNTDSAINKINNLGIFK